MQTHYHSQLDRDMGVPWGPDRPDVCPSCCTDIYVARAKGPKHDWRCQRCGWQT